MQDLIERVLSILYRIESVFNVYISEFRLIGHEDDWPSYDGPRIWPNPRMMRVKRGSPVSSKIRNNMDDVEHDGVKRCGLCLTWQKNHQSRVYRENSIASIALNQ
ncbi:hypothetical protein AHAS_Ahas09G0160300 [Arachis hypogaea]